MAGVMRRLLCRRTKLYCAKWSDTAASRFSRFLLNALVSRVNLRMNIRMFRLFRSTIEVEALNIIERRQAIGAYV